MKNTVSYLNSEIANDAESFVLRCERGYHGKLKNLASVIAGKPDLKIIMVAGPSGSGKTTSSHILREKLNDEGINSQILSLDNFFLGREKLPLQPDGDYDFESVYALDLDRLDLCFTDLINNGRCAAPVFDFKTGYPADRTLDIELPDNEVLVIEGLHALNPLVSKALPKNTALKVFVSVASSIYGDDGMEVLSGQQVRFCRRMSRDNIYRNASAQNTIKMWRDVCDGEKKWITPFKDGADITIDTFHPYEINLFAKRITEMLRLLSRGLHDSVYVDKIREGLEKFLPLDIDFVPQDSLIREFVEGGKFEAVT